MIHDRWLATAFVFLAAFLVATPLSAEPIPLEFVGGGSDVNPNTSVVDAYPGKAGLGWAWGWGQRQTGTHTVATDNTSPLHTGPGGDLNYLECTVTSTSTSRKYGSVARLYTDIATGGIDVTKTHALQWLYRVDEDLAESESFTAFDDRYQMWDEAIAPGGTIGDTVAANSAWSISVYGGAHTGDPSGLTSDKVGHWIVYNGNNDNTGFENDRNVDTGIVVTTGQIYQFDVTVDMDPVEDDGDAAQTWDVVITDFATGTVLFDSKEDGYNPDTGGQGYPEGLGWRISAPTVGGAPHFNGCTDYDPNVGVVDLREYSFDAVYIVPEPSTLALCLTLIVAGFWSFKRPRR